MAKIRNRKIDFVHHFKHSKFESVWDLVFEFCDLFVIWCLVFGILFCCYVPALGKTRPDDYLDFGISARPAGMAGAYTSLADDVDSLHWNPAGLDGVFSRGVTASASSLGSDLGYSSIGSTYRFGHYGAVGLGWMRLASPNIEVTDASGSSLGNDEYATNAVLLGFGAGHPSLWWLSWGVAGKYLKQEFGRFNEHGLGISAGLKIRTGIFNFGFTTQDIGGLKMRGDSFDSAGSGPNHTVPAQIRAGTSATFKHKITGTEFTGAIDVTNPFKGNLHPWDIALGAELAIAERFFFRGGWIPDTAATAGLAFRFKRFALDYSAMLTKRLVDMHRVSLTWFY